MMPTNLYRRIKLQQYCNDENATIIITISSLLTFDDYLRKRHNVVITVPNSLVASWKQQPIIDENYKDPPKRIPPPVVIPPNQPVAKPPEHPRHFQFQSLGTTTDIIS